jgi:hypothetical protein
MNRKSQTLSNTEESECSNSVSIRANSRSTYFGGALFFWGFISAAFVGYGALYKREAPELALVLACFGLVCSVAWTLANRGSKYWQENWEQKVHRAELDVLGEEFFARQEQTEDWKNCWLRARRFSVSKLAIALSDFTVLTWIVLISVIVFDGISFTPKLSRAMLVVGTIIFCVLMGWAGQSSPRPTRPS